MALKSLLDDLASAVTCARTGDYAGASSLSAKALAHLDSYFATVKVPESLMQKIASSLEATLLMQHHQDWVGWADIVEYELPDLLKQCAGK